MMQSRWLPAFFINSSAEKRYRAITAKTVEEKILQGFLQLLEGVQRALSAKLFADNALVFYRSAELVYWCMSQ